ALGRGDSTVSFMARRANCRVVPVDLGMLDFPGAPGVEARRVRNGTGDFTREPAMTRAECVRAIETGITLAGEQSEMGADLLLLGEMGIGNTTTSCAVAGALLHRTPQELAGRGAGLSDAGLARKIAAIEDGLRLHRPDPRDPVDVLAKVGGLDLAALCGLCLGGAAYRVPVLLDGLITGVAALCAISLCPAAGDYLLASHRSAEPAAALVLEHLGLEPLICAGLRLGEGSGAVAALPLLDLALEVYHSGHTFDHLGIDAYTPQQ
ncbi:MAG: nicotinate-nucleotide--dimethylbenzimidazole phosphoribosyltransferase, partial [Oscillospiraceae bacterium]|nr:nicotinate-nucleotide--dimethylbenzimidazole phosphoribosyltransferase [Oscillospiraceae bacterium]